MWNRSTPHSVGNPQSSIWSPEQLARLKHEWGRLRWSYACHPAVRVVALAGEPPAEYQIEYQVRTLAMDEEGQVSYADTCAVHVLLGPDFPYAPPVVIPLAAVFHPNISAENVQIIPPWQPSDTLVDLVQRIGALLAFRSYDPNAFWNPAAMEWLTQNVEYLPTDPNVNLGPDAGGDPLQRLRESGQAALEQVRANLQWMGTTLVEAKEPVSFEEMQRFAVQTHLGLALYASDGIPASLGALARELEQWAGELPQAQPVFESLARLKTGAAAAQEGATRLESAQKGLESQLAGLDALAPNAAGDQTRRIVRQLPSMNDLLQIQAQLRAHLGKAERRFAAARQHSEPLALGARPAPPFCPPLQQILESQTTQQTNALAEARVRLDKAIGAVAPVIERAKLELAALEKLLAWREYSDLRAKADSLIAQIKAWGGAGVQAYFVSNAGGEYGPFEFEQNLDLGSVPVVVRHVGRTGLEVVAVQTGQQLGRCESGDLVVDMPGSEPGEAFATTFRMTRCCDDLAVQVNYLQRQMQALLPRLGGEAPAAASWCGKVLAAQVAPAPFATFKAHHGTGIAMLGGIVDDLGALAAYKERLATYFLLTRLNESVQQWQTEYHDARALIARADKRVSEILMRASKDEADNPIIPAKLEKDYHQCMEQRKQGQSQIERLEKLRALAARQARLRLGSPSMLGLARAPALKVLAPLPTGLGELAAAMSDSAITELATAVGAALGVELDLPHLQHGEPAPT